MIRQLEDGKLSGAVILQTDTERAIVLRFSAGKIVRVNAGGTSAEDVLSILQGSNDYGFNFSAMTVEDGTELMSVADLVERLGVDENEALGTSDSSKLLEAGTTQAPAATNAAAGDSSRTFLNTLLVQLAAEAIGPMASMVVDQAIENGGSIDQVIAGIAEQIPDRDAASRFTRLAKESSMESI